MPNEKNKWIEAIGKLITLTQERKLVWRFDSLFHNYQADYGGKTVILQSGSSPTLFLKDPKSEAMWEFPSSEANEHLLQAVEYQLVGVGDFVDGLLTKSA